MPIPVAMRRTGFLLIAVIAAVAVAAGCGGSESSGTAPVPSVKSLNQVAVRTERAGSYRFDMTMRMSIPGLSEALELEADGAVDEAGRRATMTMDFGSFPQVVGAEGVSGDDLKMEMLFDWPIAYVRMPFLSERIPGNKPWVKLDLDALARRQGVELPSVTSLGQNDPSAFLDFLRATGDLRVLGQQEIDGVSTTHYLARIDFGAYVERLPAKPRKQLAAMLAQLKQLTQNGQFAPLVDAWVDGEGLLRRFAMSFSLSSGGQSAEMSLTMNLHDFGADVDVSPPDPSQVASLTALGG
jgi:hypothetical protein